MKMRIVIFSTTLLLLGGLSFNFNANAGYPCPEGKVPVLKKKFIGELWCRDGGNDCIKCKRSLG